MRDHLNRGDRLDFAAAFVVACCVTLWSAALAAGAQSEDPKTTSPGDASSPMVALQLQSEAILAAATLDDVIHLMPEAQAARVGEMSAEQKAAGLEKWKESVSRMRPTAERVAGNEAVVVLSVPDSADRLGVRLLRMTRIDGSWQTSGGTSLMTAVPGATGEFTVSGAAETGLAEGMVAVTRVNGVPILRVADMLAEALSQESEVARVQIPLPVEHGETCLEPGSLRIVTVESGGEYGVSVPAGFWPRGVVEGEEFDQEATGVLEITEVEEGRFSGTFELTAANADGETVSVQGRLGRVLMPCVI